MCAIMKNLEPLKMNVVRYNESYKEEWDAFVRASRNGTFLFEREYMDYHADRFRDHSLLFFQNNKLKCLLPANESADTLYSHQGLTYGGLIVANDTFTGDIESAFDTLMYYLGQNNFQSLIYKTIPYIYWKQPSAEDNYFLYRLKANRIACALSATICLADRLPYSRERKRAVRRGREVSLQITESDSLGTFWRIMQTNMMARFGTAPVHSEAEMDLLKKRFPEQIRLFVARENDEEVAGALIYVTDKVIRIQYGHASPRGKEIGALDCVYDHIAALFEQTHHYLDFGQCTVENGNVLNKGLMHQKEGFGARGTLYEIYELKV